MGYRGLVLLSRNSHRSDPNRNDPVLFTITRRERMTSLTILLRQPLSWKHVRHTVAILPSVRSMKFTARLDRIKCRPSDQLHHELTGFNSSIPVTTIRIFLDRKVLPPAPGSLFPGGSSSIPRSSLLGPIEHGSPPGCHASTVRPQTSSLTVDDVYRRARLLVDDRPE